MQICPTLFSVLLTSSPMTSIPKFRVKSKFTILFVTPQSIYPLHDPAGSVPNSLGLRVYHPQVDT